MLKDSDNLVIRIIKNKYVSMWLVFARSFHYAEACGNSSLITVRKMVT